jgi:hypothetical protein
MKKSFMAIVMLLSLSSVMAENVDRDFEYQTENNVTEKFFGFDFDFGFNFGGRWDNRYGYDYGYYRGRPAIVCAASSKDSDVEEAPVALTPQWSWKGPGHHNHGYYYAYGYYLGETQQRALNRCLAQNSYCRVECRDYRYRRY